MDAKEIIRALDLQKHPLEGGFYIETFRSKLTTAIYYLLTPDSFSEMHRLKSDEIFHFYLGDPVEMLQLFPDGRGALIRMGCDIRNGYHPQVVVSGKVWQGCRLMEGGRFALLGTTMSPGFDSSEYESGKRDELIRQYPDYQKLLTCLTRSP
jgi:predicted cupin superfamily sugar epimerase